MNEVVKIEISVEPETARALGDARRKLAVEKLVDRLVRLPPGNDPLVGVLEATRQAAHDAGLTDDDIECELAAFRAERRR